MVGDAGGLGLEVADVVVVVVVVLVPVVLVVLGVVVVAVVVAVVVLVVLVEEEVVVVVVVGAVVVDDGGDDADDFSPLHLPPPLADRRCLGVLADNLVPCVKQIYNDVYECYYKIKNNWPKDVKLLMSP